MTKPRLCLFASALLFIVSITQVNASPQKTKRAARRTVAGQRAPKSEATPTPMRLVVQQGQARLWNGFTLFSPDGRLVATGDGGAGDVVLWDVATGREVRRLTDNKGDPGAQDVDGW